MKFYNICTRNTYEHNGETKTRWLNCGTLRETNEGKKFLELNMFPNTPFYVFEPKPKETQQTQQSDSSDWDQDSI